MFLLGEVSGKLFVSVGVGYGLLLMTDCFFCLQVQSSRQEFDKMNKTIQNLTFLILEIHIMLIINTKLKNSRRMRAKVRLCITKFEK